MATLIQTRKIFRDLLQGATTTTKALIHNQYPDEYAFAMCAFELTDWAGDTLDVLVFPIMPSQISDSESKAIDIKKTSAGVISHYNATFVPHDINISGNFGRSLKLLVGRKEYEGSAFRIRPRFTNFSFDIKTGYGVSKVLEEIIDRSFDVDSEGRSNLLFFHNASRNANYIVEVINKRFTQSQNKLDIIDYSITMKAVAPSSAVVNTKNRTSTSTLLKSDLLQKGVLAASSSVSKELRFQIKDVIGRNF